MVREKMREDLKNVELKDILERYNYKLYDQPEIDALIDEEWRELDTETKRGYEIPTDEDPMVSVDPTTYRHWETEGGPGRMIWTVIMYDSGVIEIGDEGMGIVETGRWDLL